MSAGESGKSRAGRLRRFVALSPSDRVLLARAFAYVAAFRVGLSILPFRRFRGLLGAQRDAASSMIGSPLIGPSQAAFAPPGSRGPSQSRRDASIERLAWAVQTAARLVPRATCLTQALALHRLLRRAGQASILNIGIVRHVDGSHEDAAVANLGSSGDLPIRSHAWVEHGGRCWLITQSEAERFTRLVSWSTKN